MSNISEEFVNTILEANAMLPHLSGGDVKLGNGNKWNTPTKAGAGSDSQENQGKGSGDGGVTSDQTAGYKAASNAGPSNDTFSHEAKKDPASAGMDNFGLPSNIGNKWAMPKTLKDHKEPGLLQGSDDRIKTLEEAVQNLCDIVSILAEARTAKEKDRDAALDAKFGSKKKEQPRYDSNGNPLNQAAKDLLKKVTKGAKPASKKASQKAAKAHGEK